MHAQHGCGLVYSCDKNAKENAKETSASQSPGSIAELDAPVSSNLSTPKDLREV